MSSAAEESIKIRTCPKERGMYKSESESESERSSDGQTQKESRGKSAECDESI
jgi:hypothetical protein